MPLAALRNQDVSTEDWSWSLSDVGNSLAYIVIYPIGCNYRMFLPIFLSGAEEHGKTDSAAA
jgi:hypothetical protein